ncbi:hypothetical protein G7B40_015745 [Aetokthonos hydrillicola Thurmond2011]|jgi:vacuolar-type H+-ATPase catalytic subunit A/Vma1|uniref:Uncharacterized protein n=1 Tax=Aetokthonos hydrillicola Thurmond2011 TaxID=2712845 RepID=A0AAP5I702_9CYAN|nr:hypothetical protein [Aetokthonos hydrillicola]MBW4588661.1 hypothetical protein [Aetokthonos hydrillicola CCALA 1050]MDR9896006.1 hypothetical protein [Aetokthonos hydrillicola Thurmond2011]
MHTLNKLQSALNDLNRQRTRIAGEGWYLQNCWLVKVKPGGTARTEHQYWQVRSRQPMFNGKTLKHLKSFEVDDYKAAIARGKQLKQMDCHIEKLQQQIEQLTAITHSVGSFSKSRETEQLITRVSTDTSRQTLEQQAESTIRFTNLIEQDLLVNEVITKSQELRASLREALAFSKVLAAINLDLRNSNPFVH